MALTIVGTPYEKANSNAIAAFNATGASVVVVVSVGVSGSTQDTTAVSFGGQAMTTSADLRQLDPDGWTYTRIFYLFNPPSGSSAITVTASDNAATAFFLIALSGADTTGIGNTNKASGNSNHPAVAVTATAADNWIIFGVSNGTDGTAVSANDGSTLVNEIIIAGSNGRAGMLRETTVGAGATTVGATTAADFWSIVGLEIKAVVSDLSISVSDTITITDTDTVATTTPRVDTLTDGFEDGTIDLATYNLIQNGGATITETGGRLVLAMPGASTAATHADQSTDRTYDLTGSAFSIKVLEVPSAATTAFAGIRIGIDDDNWFRWLYQSGNLMAQRNSGTAQATLATLTLDLAVHRYWRIREAAGTVYWDTSVDGQAWTNRASYVYPIAITNLTLRMTAICIGNETNPGNFIVDNLNLTPLEPNVSETITITESTTRALSLDVTESETITITDSPTTAVVAVPTLQVSVLDNITVVDTVNNSRTNMIKNPSFEVNISDSWPTFGPGTITRTRDTVEKVFGTASYKMDTNGVNTDGGSDTNFTLTAGTYTLSGYIKTENATGDAKLVLRNRTNFNGDISLTLNNSIPTRDWTRVSGSFTVPGTDSFDVVFGIGPYGSPGQGIAWFDGIMLEMTASLGDYFDGSSAGATWTGTAHNSASTMAGYVVITTPVPELAISVSDTITVSDSVDPELVSFIGKSEAITITEALSVTLPLTISKSETITVTEARTVFIPQLNIAVSETVTITDSVQANSDISIVASETITVSEAAFAVLIALINVSEAITIADSANVATVLGIAKTETITVTDSATVAPIVLTVTASELITIAEVTTLLLPTLSVAVNEVITIADVADPELESHIRESESITVSETVDLELESNVQVSETITVTDAPIVSAGTLGGVAVVETITVSEAVALDIPLNISVADTVTISENRVVVLPELHVSVVDTVTLSESTKVVSELHVNVAEAITITDSVTMFTDKLYLAVSETIVVQEQVIFQPEYFKNQPFYLEIGDGLSMILGAPRMVIWGTNGRPQNPRLGEFGFNDELNQIEIWNGQEWRKIATSAL